MTISVYVPVALSLLLTVISRTVAVRLSPSRAALALVVAVLLCTVAATWGLLLLGATLVGSTPIVIEEAAKRGIPLPEPVPELVAGIAMAALVWGIGRTIRVRRIRRAAARDLREVCKVARGEEMVVVPVAAAHAIAVPGRPGRILITQGMLSLLDADERRAVLAHERAHLRGRHHRLCAVAEFCAGLNPLLAPASSAIAFLVERSADEYAAEVTGSRELIARALAKAALAGMGAEPCGGLAFHGPGVIARIAALNAAPPRRAGMVSGGMLVLGLTTAAAAVQATVAFIELFGVLLPG